MLTDMLSKTYHSWSSKVKYSAMNLMWCTPISWWTANVCSSAGLWVQWINSLVWKIAWLLKLDMTLLWNYYNKLRIHCCSTWDPRSYIRTARGLFKGQPRSNECHFQGINKLCWKSIIGVCPPPPPPPPKKKKKEWLQSCMVPLGHRAVCRVSISYA